MNPMVCTVCGGPLKPQLPRVTDPQSFETFAILRCAGCGLGHTVPRPADLGDYYGPPYYGNRHSFTAAHCVRRRFRLVSKLVGRRDRPRLLDLGCGDCSFLLRARENGWAVGGTEMNLETARKYGLDVRDSFADFAPDGPFDCITMWHSLEHFPDPRATVAGLAGMLKPDGVLVIAVPDAGGWQSQVFGRYWFHRDVPRHLYHHDKRSLKYLVRAAGLKAARWWHQELEYDPFGWVQSALNALFPVPNVFFHTLIGRRRRVGRVAVAASVALGALLTVFAVPAVAFGTAARRGGTIIVAAKRPAVAREAASG